MNDGKKQQAAESLIQELSELLKKTEIHNSALLLRLQGRDPRGMRNEADSLIWAAHNIRRIAKRMEPLNKKCARTCPELCPNHHQAKVKWGGVKVA